MYEKTYIRAIFCVFRSKPPVEERAEKADLRTAAPKEIRKALCCKGLNEHLPVEREFFRLKFRKGRLTVEFKVRLFLDGQLLERDDYKNVQICSKAVDRIVNDVYEKRRPEQKADLYAPSEED